MFLRMFGVGAMKAIAGGKVQGVVTKVSTCYWLKVNTKAIRTHAGDGAVYPHIIHFAYQVAGRTYAGKRWVYWNKRCPVQGEKLTVYYEEDAPEKFGVII